jgi:septal ring factor EnvC (AmiA/AmiB activator)
MRRGGNLDTQVLISVGCTVVGLLVGYLAYKREKEGDIRNDASDSAVIRTKLDNINAGVESIRIDIKANEKRTNELSEKLIRVEESAKQAHKRLDSLEQHKGGTGNEN